MKYVEVIADSGSADTVSAIAEKVNARDFRLGVVDDDGMQQMRLLVADSQLQSLLDTLQNILGAQPMARILVMPVEASLPREEKVEEKKDTSGTTREALYESIEKSSRLDINYAILVMLSTVVAAIGMIENNVAVIIGAMVIAPLLGPNLALSLGTALGDIVLMRKAMLTLFAGIMIAVGLSIGIGFFWPYELDSFELLMRSEVGLDSIALALASGAAAALSVTTGLPSVLVGVMVAVALLPPAAAMGLMLGGGHVSLAIGAGLLLAINIVSVNLASKIVFLFRGVRPRTWLEKEKAKRAMIVYVVVWIVTLLLLVLAIFARGVFPGNG